MTGKLASHTSWAVAVLVEVVNGADVVEATTSNVVTAGGICTSHDP